ncbi:hypothetical protein EVAR_6319_1 [Eumeta japonica]|uniref:Uncharacterized protein n=1 Tax=Eumeta variegata TaxID=151549 RepID=A0A4C1TBE6_EUMVA|nr:hypothetical protein EVAR_6319_1 [Eumeta japonica]
MDRFPLSSFIACALLRACRIKRRLDHPACHTVLACTIHFELFAHSMETCRHLNRNREAPGPSIASRARDPTYRRRSRVTSRTPPMGLMIGIRTERFLVCSNMLHAIPRRPLDLFFHYESRSDELYIDVRGKTPNI